MRHEIDFNGGTRANPKREITEAEKEYILDHYKTATNEEMSTHLGVSHFKLICWMKELKIKKARLSPWRNKTASNERTQFFRWDKNNATI